MTCPICKSSSVKAYNPFCSKRCADIDLGKWLTGAYAVASDGEGDEIELEQAQKQAEDKLH